MDIGREAVISYTISRDVASDGRDRRKARLVAVACPPCSLHTISIVSDAHGAFVAYQPDAWRMPGPA